MPDIRDDNTVEALANEYCINGGNKSQALLKVGYGEGYATTGEAIALLENPRVKAAIKRIKIETSYTLDDYQQDLRDDRKLARDLKQPSAAISGSIALGRSMGYDKDNEVGKDKSDAAPKTAQEQAATDAAVEAYHRSMSLNPSIDKELG